MSSGRNLRVKESFFQRSADFDAKHFPALANINSLSCPVNSVTYSGEFGCDDADIFSYDPAFANHFPDALPTISLASKTATALMKSDRFISLCLGTVISEIHSTTNRKVDICSDTDIARIRTLMDGGFEVGLLSPFSSSYGRFDRDSSNIYPRRVLVSSMMLNRMQLTAAEDPAVLSDAAKKTKLRKYAAVLVITLMHEAGGHCLHGMIRPDYFFDANMKQIEIMIDGKMTKKVSPVRYVKTLEVTDFGTMLELEYFGAIPHAMNNKDIRGEFVQYDIDAILMEFKEYHVFIPITVTTRDFSPDTYEPEGDGMFCEELVSAREVAANHDAALQASTLVRAGGPSLTTSTGSSADVSPLATTPAIVPISDMNREEFPTQHRERPMLPAPDEYEGDPLMKARLIFIPRVVASRNLEADITAVASTSTGVLYVPSMFASQQVQQIGGDQRGDNGECY